jgi:hypothetical protein
MFALYQPGSPTHRSRLIFFIDPGEPTLLLCLSGKGISSTASLNSVSDILPRDTKSVTGPNQSPGLIPHLYLTYVCRALKTSALPRHSGK